MEWVVKEVLESEQILHYLDYFLFVGRAGEQSEWTRLMRTMEQVAQELVVLLASEKTKWLATILNFLGLELDSVAMVSRLAGDKLGAWLLDEVL